MKKHHLMTLFLCVGMAARSAPAAEYLIPASSWTENLPLVFMGLLLVVTGILTAVIFLIRRKESEIHLLYLAVFITGYGTRSVADNDLLMSAMGVPDMIPVRITAFVTDVLPIFFILFMKSFIGWGWRRSVFWLLMAWTVYGTVATLIGIVTGVPKMVGGTFINTVMVMLIIVVLGMNHFLAHRKGSREDRIIGIGLMVFIATVLFNNLSFTDFSRHGTLVEQVGFFFFLSCMMYAAVRRSIFTEREYRVILHDLETARQIQQGILPQDLPRSPAFSVAARYIPMTQVGGDFYAFHQDDDHHAGILVADVSGHGIPAALLASMIKVAFSSLADRAAHPAELLGSVNNALTGHLNHEFITTAYLWFNFSDMTMQYASAGHPAPVLVRDGKAGDSLFTARGIPLGITGEVNYRQGSVVLLPGDRIVVYTDGITETFNPRGELFGKQRFFAEIEAAGKLSGEKFVDQLIDNVISWSGRKSTDSLDDDVTLIVIDIR